MSKKSNKVSYWGEAVLLVLALSVIGFAFYAAKHTPKEGGETSLGAVVSPNSTLGVNTSSTVTSTVSTVIPARLQTQKQWCYNGAAGIWIGVTTTQLVAGSVGSGFYVATATALNSVMPDLSDYAGNFYGVTVSGTTSTIVCTRF